MLNRDIYLTEPKNKTLANNGVAVVKDDQSEAALSTLRYELETFVCEGEYQAGLDKILSTYLRNLGGNNEQPGIWISGFYGSGKSHLAKMLRAFWTNQVFSDGMEARDIAELPQNIKDHFVELSTAAKRHGGLHAASGTLGAGITNNVRLALLNIIFNSVGLPEQYNQARFVLWLKRKGIFQSVKQAVEAGGDSWTEELKDLYMSRNIASALMEHDSTLGDSPSQVRQLLREQYPHVSDVTNQQMVSAIYDALATEGEFPLTLVVLDEVQQYIGDDAERAHLVQEVIETCCKDSKFKSKLLFVATGQSALSGMPNLQRLMGRFQVPVQLSDTDVESVIRKIILQKKDSAKPQVENLLQTNLGEISRQLRGTKIEHNRDDERVLVADYPLLPVRRRFWEKVLQMVDTTGTVSQLRNQLKVVHEATIATADKPLGHVVPADFIYDQIAINLLQTGVISKEISELIGRFASQGNEDDRLKSRLLALILLIGKLPTEAAADIGVRATPEMLADLLIEDLNQGRDTVRAAVPKALEELQQDGYLMAMDTVVGTEYRLQTQESSQWYDTLRQEEADLRGNTQRVENIRADLLQNYVRKEVGKVRLAQGKVNETRNLHVSFDTEVPRDAHEKIYAWVQDGWSVDANSFTSVARQHEPSEPTIFVYIPAKNRSELTSAIISEYAANATLEKRGLPGTDAGKDARSSMQTRHREAQKQKELLLREIFDGVQVLQAGGAEEFEGTLAERVEKAAKASLVRLYREFDAADNPHWGKVYERARKEGGHTALELLGYQGEPEKHPVCAQIMRYMGASKRGNEIREHFTKPPYGWPQDAIEGALFVLLASGEVVAKDSQHNPVAATELERKNVGQTTFAPESITIRPVDLIKIRGVLNACGVNTAPGDEANSVVQLLQKARQLANEAGGDAPLPARPDLSLFNEIERQSGNAKLKMLLDEGEAIKALFKEWQTIASKIEPRRNEWWQLKDLLDLAKDLAFYPAIKAEADAISANRSLLDDPNPVAAHIKELSAKLREALQHHVQSYLDTHADQLQLLEADAHWQQLDTAKQQELLQRRQLLTMDEPSYGSTEALIEVLHHTSLSQWADRTASLASKFESARLEAVKLLQPKVQHMHLPRVTIQTEAELEQWLVDVKQQVLDKLNDGPVTF
ncbi:hypothetical protein AKN90_00615 [Thiopseudomonas alkaliphila]|uniref:BREX system P-loop protein BrxC n=1 Tax=Thiopseudomonas alkaliphila TaxID=1697053 RepID=UPI00069E793B|nr:BREX system P-loop protein BrxC [Thiopseudomonas alkaliphila]AKX54390.1 hypothetical protein AKN90_00615 [Thiopseudomonas alkaliphila]